MITTVLFLCAYGLYCFFTMNKTKPLAWLVGNIVFLAAGALFVYTHQDIYFIVGALCAAGFVAYQALAVKLPLLANWKVYLKLAVSNLMFWPVGVFEAVYTYLSPKL